jgi:hypothetical protein
LGRREKKNGWGCRERRGLEGGTGKNSVGLWMPLTVVSDHQTLGMRVEMKQLGRVSAKQPREQSGSNKPSRVE